MTNKEHKLYSKMMRDQILFHQGCSGKGVGLSLVRTIHCSLLTNHLKKGLLVILLFPFVITSAFNDVPDIDPQVEVFAHLRDVGIMKGNGDGNFYPSAIVSRAEALTIAMRAGGIVIPPEFSGDTHYGDIDPNSWYAPVVARGVETGIIKSTAINFHPQEAISKAEFLTFLFRATLVKEKHFQNTRDVAADIPNDAWFKPYFAYAKKYQIAYLPSDNLYRPMKKLTRREVARMTYRQLRIFHGNGETKMVVEVQGEIAQFLMLVRENKMDEAQQHLHKILELNETLIRTNNNTDAVAAKAISKSMEYLSDSLRYFRYGKDLDAIENLHLASKYARKAENKEGKLGEFGQELGILIVETLQDFTNPMEKRFVTSVE